MRLIAMLMLFWVGSIPVHADCMLLKLKTGRFNLPLVSVSLFNQSFDFVLDLGMAQALSVEPYLFDKIISKNGPELKQYSDLNGDKILTRQKLADKLRLNHVNFNAIEVSESKPWGLVLAASSEVEMPANTMGLGLFAKEGVLHYSRKNGYLKWCKQDCSYPPQVAWQPLQIDEEGVHLKAFEATGIVDLVLDTASTFSILKPNKAQHSIQCNLHHQYQCYQSDLVHQEMFYLLDLPTEFNADGLLGDSFFQQHDVYIDRINNRLGVISHSRHEV